MKRRLLRSVAALAALGGLSGCTALSYYAQSLSGHAQIMDARQDVGRLIDDPATPEPLRAEMASASAIRQFASDELALPDNRSYRSFVALDRDFVTLAVFAAPEFSLVPRTWCVPIYGCVPYRGYFSGKSAAKTVNELRQEGLDVYVSGIIAYSTLGWSADPLLSTMFRQDQTDLAAYIFHELAHQRVYVRGDTAFNEAFAVAVETTGVKKWLRETGDPGAVRRYETDRQRRADFLQLVSDAREELSGAYANSDSAEEKREAKATAIEQLRARYRRMRDTRWGGDGAYDAWFDAPINNAKLAATSVYSDRVPAFLRLFDLCAGDYPRFYAAVERIGDLDKAARFKALDAADSCG